MSSWYIGKTFTGATVPVSHCILFERFTTGPVCFLNTTPNGRCGHCAQCHFTEKTKNIQTPDQVKLFMWKVKSNTANNVTYLLKCPCGLTYVGKTSRPLKTRISEHRSNICNKDTKSPVAIHFTERRYNVSALKYLGIEHVKQFNRGGDINSALLKREVFWIYTLYTLSPRGINKDFDSRPFLW